MKAYKFIYILFFVCFYGCIKEVSIDFDYKKKIVVLSNISTYNQTNQFILTNNIPPSEGPMGMENYYITDATILLKDEFGNEQQINYSPFFNKAYTVDSNDFKFIEGRKYFLTITTGDGGEVSASMKMPMGVNPKKYYCDTSAVAYLDTLNNTMKRHVDLSMDFERGNDYYLAAAQVYSTCRYLNSHGNNNIDSKVSYFNFPDGDGSLNMDTVVSDYVSDTISTFSISIDSVAYFVNAIDPVFQKYKSTVSKQLAAYQDPFAQPILIYSNIQNGLGVFNGNTVRSKKIKFK